MPIPYATNPYPHWASAQHTHFWANLPWADWLPKNLRWARFRSGGMLHHWTLSDPNRNTMNVLRSALYDDLFLFSEEIWLPTSLVIRITAITLASDSATTICAIVPISDKNFGRHPLGCLPFNTYRSPPPSTKQVSVNRSFQAVLRASQSRSGLKSYNEVTVRLNSCKHGVIKG